MPIPQRRCGTKAFLVYNPLLTAFLHTHRLTTRTACGVLHVSKLFRKIVLIATGSGIGPCLAVLRSGEVPCRVLWSTRSPRKTFGDGLVGDVLKADKDAVIYDTASGSRPDVVKMAYSMYRESKAEAVVIISNPSLTYKVVYGLESRGVPAFGAIWDS